jgi:pimeloyl-ACP methyl ester carboxylesterase
MIMMDYTKLLPEHIEKYLGEKDLFLEIFERNSYNANENKKPPLLFVHGAYTGSWMWSKYISHFVEAGYCCYVMNMRSHYKSRTMDMTQISFEDYLEDIRENIVECGEPPILIGFSMGGMLCQKIAEEGTIAGLILVDTSISKEVNIAAPYENPMEDTLGIVMPAPLREEESIDEAPDDIAFQKKFLAMESSKAIGAMACWIRGKEGISVDNNKITCPCLVIRAVNSERDDLQGRATAEQLKGEYLALWNTSHTGLLVGQRYQEAVDRILEWLEILVAKV